MGKILMTGQQRRGKPLTYSFLKQQQKQAKIKILSRHLIKGILAGFVEQPHLARQNPESGKEIHNTFLVPSSKHLELLQMKYASLGRRKNGSSEVFLGSHFIAVDQFLCQTADSKGKAISKYHPFFLLYAPQKQVACHSFFPPEYMHIIRSVENHVIMF